MSSKLDNLGWYYRGIMEQTVLPESLDHWIVYYVLVTFTIVGFFTISARLIHFVRLMLSLFVLPGEPVSLSLAMNAVQSG